MTIWEVAGWIGNACFFSRFFVQWMISERARRSVAPRIFWHLSLVGTLLLGGYAVQEREPVLLAGYVINSLLYLRNLAFFREPDRVSRMNPFLITTLGVAATLLLFTTGALKARDGWGDSPLWLTCVVVGQGIWCSRFVLQWWFAERRGKSYFPRPFWYMSLIGNALLLAYACHIRDAIFIAGFLPGPLVQIRNLMLESARAKAAGQPSAKRQASKCELARSGGAGAK